MKTAAQMDLPEKLVFSCLYADARKRQSFAALLESTKLSEGWLAGALHRLVVAGNIEMTSKSVRVWKKETPDRKGHWQWMSVRAWKRVK